MRIKTAGLRRSIDKAKTLLHSRNMRFLSGFYWLATFTVASGRSLFLTVLFIIAFVFHFAAFQLGALLLLGICTAGLFLYRAVNSLFRVLKI